MSAEQHILSEHPSIGFVATIIGFIAPFISTLLPIVQLLVAVAGLAIGILTIEAKWSERKLKRKK